MVKTYFFASSTSLSPLVKEAERLVGRIKCEPNTQIAVYDGTAFLPGVKDVLPRVDLAIELMEEDGLGKYFGLKFDKEPICVIREKGISGERRISFEMLPNFIDSYNLMHQTNLKPQTN